MGRIITREPIPECFSPDVLPQPTPTAKFSRRAEAGTLGVWICCFYTNMLTFREGTMIVKCIMTRHRSQMKSFLPSQEETASKRKWNPPKLSRCDIKWHAETAYAGGIWWQWLGWLSTLVLLVITCPTVMKYTLRKPKSKKFIVAGIYRELESYCWDAWGSLSSVEGFQWLATEAGRSSRTWYYPRRIVDTLKTPN